MKLSEFKNHLATVDQLAFILPDGNAVPAHFHLTEIGQIDKRFMDCGGTVRSEMAISMQLWTSVDLWHRLDAVKTLRIIDQAIATLDLGDHPIEVEYQGSTVQKFHLAFRQGVFHLTAVQTACLASDACGIPTLQEVKTKAQSCCAPGSGCC
jgi:hypothetical protein